MKLVIAHVVVYAVGLWFVSFMWSEERSPIRRLHRKGGVE